MCRSKAADASTTWQDHSGLFAMMAMSQLASEEQIEELLQMGVTQSHKLVMQSFVAEQDDDPPLLSGLCSKSSAGWPSCLLLVCCLQAKSSQLASLAWHAHAGNAKSRPQFGDLTNMPQVSAKVMLHTVCCKYQHRLNTNDDCCKCNGMMPQVPTDPTAPLKDLPAGTPFTRAGGFHASLAGGQLAAEHRDLGSFSIPLSFAQSTSVFCELV